MSDRRNCDSSLQRKSAVISSFESRHSNSSSRKVRERLILPRDQALTSIGANLYRTYSHYGQSKSGVRFGSSEVQDSKKSEKEKEADRRRKNKEKSRRVREKEKAEKQRMVKEYEANEIRIKELEIMADELSGELRRMNTAPTTYSHGSNERAGSRPYNNDEHMAKDETRPSWFGSAF